MRLPTAAFDGPIPAAAYDQALKELFISDSNFNSIEVYSTVDGHKVGEISVPGPAGLGFSPDFSKLYVGTITPFVYVVDPVALHVTGQIVFPASMLLATPLGTTEMPVMPYPMADGSVILGLGVTSQSSSEAVFVGVGNLVRYDPSKDTFISLDPGPSGVFSNPSRSLDGKYLFIYGLTNAGEGLLLYSVNAQGYLPGLTQVQNFASFLAANSNGSQFATVQYIDAPGTGSFNSQVNFWGTNLQAQTQYTVSGTVTCAMFSRDGKYFYLMTDLGSLVALDTQAGTPVGYVGLSMGSLSSVPAFFDVDETYHLFGVEPGGAFILNASQMQSSPPLAIAEFIGLPSTEATPNVGPPSGGTQVQFTPAPLGASSADGVASSMEAYFGATPATQDAVGPSPSSSDGENFLTATAPAATNPGPVTVVLTDASNDVVFLPDAYTYGPRVLRVQPNVASAAGGDRITIYAYGLGFFNTQQDIVQNIHVTIGGVQVSMKDATLNPYASNNYPEQSITVTIPQGTPGWADVALTTSSGTDTMKRGMQYLSQEVALAGGPFGFAAYDSVRDLFYLTGSGNNVAVFNPNTQAFGQPLQSSTISAGAFLEEVALTPDSSKLLVVDPADQSVIVFDLVAGTSKSVSALLASDPANTLVQPVEIEVAANNRAFISVTPCVTNPVREINLSNLTVQPRTDIAPTCSQYVPYPEFGGASADGSTIIYAGSSGQQFGLQPSGPEYIWSYSAASDTFKGPVIFEDTPWVGGQVALDKDGSVIAFPQGTVDQRLLPLAPVAQPGFDVRLNETGSLLYTTGIGSGQISVSDTHNGRWQFMLAAQNANAGNGPVTHFFVGQIRPLATDPSGAKIVIALQGGLSYFQLATVPLAVGTVSPSTASAGGTIQLRGSGFVVGSSAKIGGQTASCTEIDSETLSCTVPTLPSGSASIALTNPDGQTYSFENAFVVQ